MIGKNLGFDALSKVSRDDMGIIMGCTAQNITNLKNEGAPRNEEDKSYTPCDFIGWYVKRAINKVSKGEGDSLKDEKLEQEIKKLTIKNQEMEGKLIAVETVDEIIGDRARTLSRFLVRALKENAYDMQMKTAEELIPILNEVAIGTLEVYTGKRKGD